MDSYYTAIELGTNSVKMLVCNKVNGKFVLLAKSEVPSSGIKKSVVVDTTLAVASVKKAKKDLEEKLGINIGKVVASVPTVDCEMDISVGNAEIINYNCITGEDVNNAIKSAIDGNIPSNRELITAIPITFSVDGRENIKDPKGLSGKNLKVKLLLSTSPKEIIYKILEVLNISGLDTIDVGYNVTGDYYAIRNNRFDKAAGAIINIGEDTTNISIYNKGIMIKNKIINMGSINIDNDLCYICKINPKISRDFKENFVVASSYYADTNEVRDVTNINKKKVEFNQKDISKVVEARCREILKIAKKELKNLTKREISYIIITGGVSEISGFQYLVEEILGMEARVCNITTVGLRHNKYSSVFGLIKYFDSKLSLRGKKVSMIDEAEISNMITVRENKDNENIVNKVFGHFFEN